MNSERWGGGGVVQKCNTERYRLSQGVRDVKNGKKASHIFHVSDLTRRLKKSPVCVIHWKKACFAKIIKYKRIIGGILKRVALVKLPFLIPLSINLPVQIPIYN